MTLNARDNYCWDRISFSCVEEMTSYSKMTDSWEPSTYHDTSCFTNVSCAFCMMTSSSGSIFRVTGLLWGNSPVTGEFPAQRPVTRSFDIFFDLRLSKRLDKQSKRRWFETPSPSLWRHRNDISRYFLLHQHQLCFLSAPGYLNSVTNQRPCGLTISAAL